MDQDVRRLRIVLQVDTHSRVARVQDITVLSADQNGAISLHAMIDFQHAQLFIAQMLAEHRIHFGDDWLLFRRRVEGIERLLGFFFSLSWASFIVDLLSLVVRDAWVHSVLMIVEIDWFRVDFAGGYQLDELRAGDVIGDGILHTAHHDLGHDAVYCRALRLWQSVLSAIALKQNFVDAEGVVPVNVRDKDHACPVEHG